MKKIIKIRNENPTYWELLISRSKYSEDEILTVLGDATVTNEKLEELRLICWLLLEDEKGPMNSVLGFASEKHEKLYQALQDTNELWFNLSENSHLNCFPVAKWLKEIKSLNRKIKKIEVLSSKI